MDKVKNKNKKRSSHDEETVRISKPVKRLSEKRLIESELELELEEQEGLCQGGLYTEYCNDSCGCYDYLEYDEIQ